ncbi:MAG: TonB family protein [Kofleriaceae bacterium]|nr:TonB family protein [Kofleriaceae bacterium]MBP6838504.1 TonB family protein [Kofleriaceae bacterium]
MAPPRSYRRSGRPWFLAPALLASATAQAGALAVYQLTRPEPVPRLTVRLDGLGDGTVLVTQPGVAEPLLRCARATCTLDVARGQELVLVAIPDGRSTFAGWSQHPFRPPAGARVVLGDPMAGCLDRQARGASGDVADVLRCPIVVGRSFDVAVEFGRQPEELEVAWATPTPGPDQPPVELPAPEPPPPPDIDAEKLEEPVEVALLVPPPPKELPPPPKEPPPEKPAAPPPPIPDNMRMVEVPDDHEVTEAPDDATHLSDKNRDVAEETHATETNLEREQTGEAVASRQSPDTTSAEVGGPDDQIRQLEEAEATTDDREVETDHSGKSDQAKGIMTGEAGDRGEDGKGERSEPGILAMRDIGGRGAIVDRGGDGKKAGKRGLPGIKTPLTFDDYERIMGKAKVDDERLVAARKMTSKKGRWEKKLAAIKSSLENFVPDVRPGNQTALKTRAHPFAVYVARMHRRIHELWGFGFLEDLDGKGSGHPLNDFELVSTIELSINPDGSVHKATIARTSGKLEFDVAALDTVLTAAPYDETPDAIRSVDQRVYLRWAFNRNWRQCGTFNVEPYILTDIPGGIEPLAEGQVAARPKPAAPTARPVTPEPKAGAAPVAPSSTVKDERALYAVNLWVSGFATGEIEKMARFSAAPFYAGGTVAAETRADVTSMYQQLVAESGPMRDWQLVTPAEYEARTKARVELPEGSVLLLIRTERERFAVVFQRTPSGDYRATQLAR